MSLPVYNQPPAASLALVRLSRCQLRKKVTKYTFRLLTIHFDDGV